VIADYPAYVAVTGDSFTPQAAVVANLQRAQNKAQDLCERTFERGSYVETLEVIDGKVWPRAYPVTVVGQGTIDGDGQSVTIAQSFSDPIPPIALLGTPRQFVTLTYTGGFLPYGAPWAPGMVPTDLVDIVCELASRYCMPANTVAIPAGVSQVAVNGQSFGGAALGGSSAVPVAIRNALKPYWHVNKRLQ
jgi:hypothetical protein